VLLENILNISKIKKAVISTLVPIVLATCAIPIKKVEDKIIKKTVDYKIIEQVNIDSTKYNITADSLSNFTNIDSTTYTDTTNQVINYARNLLGIKFQWNGRNTSRNPNLDCMGLCFRTYADTYNEKWTKYSVYPSILVNNKILGTSVFSNPLEINNESIKKLEVGDIVYFITDVKIPDKPLGQYNGKKLWSNHMGLYSGNGKVIHASHWDGEVVEEDIKNINTKGEFYIIATRK
jgi:cell wall-associated NlpC family hydrolase